MSYVVAFHVPLSYLDLSRSFVSCLQPQHSREWPTGQRCGRYGLAPFNLILISLVSRLSLLQKLILQDYIVLKHSLLGLKSLFDPFKENTCRRSRHIFISPCHRPCCFSVQAQISLTSPLSYFWRLFMPYVSVLTHISLWKTLVTGTACLKFF